MNRPKARAFAQELVCVEDVGSVDETKLSELSEWAHKLEQSDLPELRAAGRAILALLDENELLRAELAAVPESDDELEDGEPAYEPSLADSLRSRLRRRRA